MLIPLLDRARRRWAAGAGVQRAVAFVTIHTLCAASSNGIVRVLSAEMHPFEIVFFRCLVAIAIFVPVYVRRGAAPLRTQRPGLQVVRGVLQGVSMMLFFLALSLAPLAKVAALTFTSPLFATLLALLILGEVIRARRITALAVGFVGALLIVQPGWHAIDAGSSLVLISSALAGLSFMMIKVLSRTDSSLATILIGTFVSAPVALIGAIPVWTTPSLHHVLPLLSIGILNGLGNLCHAQAIKEVDIGVLAPFEFTKLLWAALIGYVFFAEVPEAWTWIGGAIIFAAATYIAYRERRTGAAPLGGVTE